jgi:hypothetical protein
MSRALACVGLVALSLASAAGAALPRAGALVAGASLGGVRVGEPAADVRTSLGRRYGICQGCSRTTWYFTYRPFEERGLAVELTRGRVSAVYTVWQPAGWHWRALALGAVEARVTTAVGAAIPVPCAGYKALVSDTRAARTAYYIVDGRLWGFGLLRPRVNPCR